MNEAGGVHILPVRGLGEVVHGDDLADLLVTALENGGERLRGGDILVVSSKIVSKAEGRAVAAQGRDEAIRTQTVRRVAARRTPHGLAQIVEAAAGPVMAAAGVDASNVAPGTILLLPEDPDASARALRARLRALTGQSVGVILSDTAGRAWRDGQVDFALGAAGVTVTEDLRGSTDTHGQLLEVTVRAVADELAAAADLVKGKLSGVPAALLRGLADFTRRDPTTMDADPDAAPDPSPDPAPSPAPSPDPAPAPDRGAAALLRTAREDWFRFGHVEAVAAALGADVASMEPPTVPRGPLEVRLRRATRLASSTPTPWNPTTGATVTVDVTGPTARVSTDGGEAEIGALAQRIAAAAWAEDLAVRIELLPGGLRVEADELPG